MVTVLQLRQKCFVFEYGSWGDSESSDEEIIQLPFTSVEGLVSVVSKRLDGDTDRKTDTELHNKVETFVFLDFIVIRLFSCVWEGFANT